MGLDVSYCGPRDGKGSTSAAASTAVTLANGKLVDPQVVEEKRAKRAELIDSLLTTEE